MSAWPSRSSSGIPGPPGQWPLPRWPALAPRGPPEGRRLLRVSVADRLPPGVRARTACQMLTAPPARRAAATRRPRPGRSCGGGRTSGPGRPRTAGGPRPPRRPGTARRPGPARSPSRAGRPGLRQALHRDQSRSPRTTAALAGSEPLTRPGRVRFADRLEDVQHLVRRESARRIGGPPVTLVQEDAEGVDASARVSMSRASNAACSGAMYSERPDDRPEPGRTVSSVSLTPAALRPRKSITFGTGRRVVLGHQDVVGLQVAVDDLPPSGGRVGPPGRPRRRAAGGRACPGPGRRSTS